MKNEPHLLICQVLYRERPIGGPEGFSFVTRFPSKEKAEEAGKQEKQGCDKQDTFRYAVIDITSVKRVLR